MANKFNIYDFTDQDKSNWCLTFRHYCFTAEVLGIGYSWRKFKGTVGSVVLFWQSDMNSFYVNLLLS